MTAVGRLARKTCSKMLPRTIGSFRITALGQHTLTLEKDGIPNSISFDLATHVPNHTDLHLKRVIVGNERTIPLRTQITGLSSLGVLTNLKLF